MKLKSTFVSHDSNGEQILIDVSGKSFSGLVRSNATAAFIVDCLSSDTTKEEITKKMLEKFEGATEQDVNSDIDMVLEKLRSIGALDE